MLTRYHIYMQVLQGLCPPGPALAMGCPALHQGLPGSAARPQRRWTPPLEPWQRCRRLWCLAQAGSARHSSQSWRRREAGPLSGAGQADLREACWQGALWEGAV